ncbi:glycosyltransferase [Vibrio sp. ZSDZ65]|uniref:Glycosyltransferase n=1 Tax=Vibrio qingdaonensis TaxID=2829491 RepID=A0A9X3CQZ8_9VIBR|nr:galactosyltransferase-related protein [Vibrio qingdaonensis]MCW8348062.1 glycosyltransferase [Vibrio qingdaonensis]
MTEKSVEVIMAAYNNVRDMRLVFDGYLRQNDTDFSLCITDDGSGPEVKALVGIYSSLGLNIRYLWQDDCGYRRAMALNHAIASSKADFIIMTDNDCIPSRYFIADYRARLNPTSMLFGRRVDLYERASFGLRTQFTSFRQLENPFWLALQSLKKNLKRPEMGIRFPSFICSVWNKKTRGAIGANLAVPTQSLLQVNGFDEDFEGYGMEETDLVRRLKLTGLKTETVLGRCALFHLYHKEKQQAPEAHEMYTKKKSEGKVVCANGIKKIQALLG